MIIPITQPPTVQQKIIGGEAVITGNLRLMRQKAGYLYKFRALPIPVKLIQQSNIDQPLGKESQYKKYYGWCHWPGKRYLLYDFLLWEVGHCNGGPSYLCLISYAIVRSIPIVLTLPV